MRTAHARTAVTLYHLSLMAMFGVLMFFGKLLMEGLPNIHPVGMFTVVFAIVYRGMGILPVLVFSTLTLIYAGPVMWPYYYLFGLLWALTLLIPRRAPRAVRGILYCVLLGLHGLAFGTLWAPAQVLMFGLPWSSVGAWIAAGFAWDVTHCIGNVCMGFLVLPLSELLAGLERRMLARLPGGQPGR